MLWGLVHTHIPLGFEASSVPMGAVRTISTTSACFNGSLDPKNKDEYVYHLMENMRFTNNWRGYNIRMCGTSHDNQFLTVRYHLWILDKLINILYQICKWSYHWWTYYIKRKDSNFDLGHPIPNEWLVDEEEENMKWINSHNKDATDG